MRRPFDPEKEVLDYCKHICHAHKQERRDDKRQKTWYWDYPAMASICHDAACIQKRSGHSHYPDQTDFAPVLKNALVQLGQIGKRSAKPGTRYIIGNCAEQHAANHYMKGYNENSLQHLYFSSAMRPRTKQIYPPCDNCKDTFPNL